MFYGGDIMLELSKKEMQPISILIDSDNIYFMEGEITQPQ
jgi:hypothetical protein